MKGLSALYGIYLHKKALLRKGFFGSMLTSGIAYPISLSSRVFGKHVEEKVFY